MRPRDEIRSGLPFHDAADLVILILRRGRRGLLLACCMKTTLVSTSGPVSLVSPVANQTLPADQERRLRGPPLTSRQFALVSYISSTHLNHECQSLQRALASLASAQAPAQFE